MHRSWDFKNGSSQAATESLVPFGEQMAHTMGSQRMGSMRLCLAAIGVLTALGFSNAQDVAETPVVKRAPLTPAEQAAVASCLSIIRGCQLPDGAFNIVNDGNAPGSPVWVAPYFVNHGALALLAASKVQSNPADIVRVGKWLEWSVIHQDAGGFWCDHTGTIASYKSNGQVDAHDSSAALFLLVLARYQQVGGNVSDAMRIAAKRSLVCIQNVTDTDGLTWAKPDYKIKFLMDNIEVGAGLAAAEKFFRATGDESEERAAKAQAALVGRGLLGYWEAAEPGRFAWALRSHGAYDGGLDQMYPHGLAQLFGVAAVSAQAASFAEVVEAFEPETTREGVGAERFLIAASQLGGPDARAWRAKAVQAASGFTPNNVYIFRPGLVVLGLLEGADWMR